MTDELPAPRFAGVEEHPGPDDFVMWVIYNRLTREHPGFYVVRRHWVRRETSERVIDPECFIHPHVEALRAQFEGRYYCQPHQPGEDFTIVETWF